MEYTYDPLGRVSSMRDPSGHVFRWAYDAAGQLIEEQLPDGRFRYTYDDAGNVASRTDPAGRTTRFVHDARGLLREVRYPDETVRFTYDPTGQLVEVQSPALTERYRYDALQRLVEVENRTLGKRLQFAYDSRGLRTRLVDPEGRTFAYDYDALGRLVRLRDPLGGETRFRYDPLSRLEALVYPNGVTTKLVFDRISRLIRLTSESPAETVLRLAYRYDAAGNPIERREGPYGPVPEGLARFGYDALDRLVRVTYPLEAIQALRSLSEGDLPPGQRRSARAIPPVQEAMPAATTPFAPLLQGAPDKPGRPGQPDDPGSGGGKPKRPGEGESLTTWPEPVAWAAYTYDPVGNRLRLETDRGTLDYAYAFLNRLVRAGAVQYRYDANGNLTEKLTPQGWVRYTYNARNQLIRVDFPDGTWVTYAYDGLGRRVRREESDWQNANQQKTEITHFLYDGFEVLMEYAGTPGEGLAPLAESYRAGGQLLAGKLFGFHGRKAQGHEDFLRTRGGLLYCHLDALGTVQALTDRAGGGGRPLLCGGLRPALGGGHGSVQPLCADGQGVRPQDRALLLRGPLVRPGGRPVADPGPHPGWAELVQLRGQQPGPLPRPVGPAQVHEPVAHGRDRRAGRHPLGHRIPGLRGRLPVPRTRCREQHSGSGPDLPRPAAAPPPATPGAGGEWVGPECPASGSRRVRNDAGGRHSRGGGRPRDLAGPDHRSHVGGGASSDLACTHCTQRGKGRQAAVGYMEGLS